MRTEYTFYKYTCFHEYTPPLHWRFLVSAGDVHQSSVSGIEPLISKDKEA
ncbi:hypothetical protein KNP414_05539 [Paenibacillus mucilaginosus KNP414]|uniref:Uncharacterized protein n=1 Tax=Paenibacillus mucilaginosus (strain KNP414) TaxID=1036673 RepID=F8FK22_PAEMK|nr:hypothetical protein KNP414_05539 [Paenibacillus mucilaginosus KNP414]